MGQITTGIRSILSSPAVYNAFQWLMGGTRGRRHFADNHVRAKDGDYVLDVGCGTAALLDFLPEVDYWGYDISESYIKAARLHFGSRGHFVCKILDQKELAALPKFDIVLASGLLHHLDDSAAVALMELAHSALKPGGRLVTIDPCFADGQNPVARLLVSRDRGQNVRTGEQYLQLAENVFSEITGTVHHWNWIPYTHWIMECVAHRKDA
jgi:SAM-dependent methyltransferase